MKHKLFKVSLALIAICSAPLYADCSTSSSTACPIAPCVAFRSQGVNAVNKMTAHVGHIHEDRDQWYSHLSATLGYSQSRKSDDLAKCLFGDCLQECNGGNPFLKIQGSDFQDDVRDSKALLADYFYLPTDYESEVSFSPKIKNFVVDFNYYVDLSGYKQGLYFRAHAPLAHTSWNLRMQENIIDSGNKDHRNGYFTTDKLNRDKLLKSFTHYACGDAAANGNVNSFLRNSGTLSFVFAGNGALTIDADNVISLDTKMTPLKCAQMSCDALKKTGFADLRFELGQRFWDEEKYHVGLNLQFAIPTGNHKKACNVFGPQLGNGHHWELGGGLNAHYDLWQSQDGDRAISFHLDANLTHLFKAHQVRTFDLKDKPLSRYMLAARFSPHVDNLLAGPTTATNSAPQNQFAHKTEVPSYGFGPGAQIWNAQYAPVANLTTLDVNVSASIQADIVAMFNFKHKDWSFDLGYNFWARSCEDIDCRTSCCPDKENLCCPSQEDRWVLKGDARMYGFATGSVTLNDTVPLSASQSNATIKNGTNQVVLDGSSNDVNSNVDNAMLAWNGDDNALINEPVAFASNLQVNTSREPIFLKCSDIDIRGARGISHKLFGHLSKDYAYANTTSHLGLGFGIEWGKTDDCCPNKNVANDDCNSNCVDCAVSQWSIWLKGGVSFN